MRIRGCHGSYSLGYQYTQYMTDHYRQGSTTIAIMSAVANITIETQTVTIIYVTSKAGCQGGNEGAMGEDGNV